jgi:hypothetical protein
VFGRIGSSLARLGRRLGGRRLAGALLVLAALGAGGYLVYTALSSDGEERSAAGPQAVVQRVEGSDEEAAELGFPAFATSNTTRVAGADPVADAAATALASHPSTGGLEGPAAVSLVDLGDWPAGIAAASLVAEPVGAPILLTDGGEVPELTASALRDLAPAGSGATDDKQAFRIGDAAEPDGLRTLDVQGSNPAGVAAEIDRLRTELAGRPEHVVVAASDEPAFAMPAAAWAARSGDPVLFSGRQTVPKATLDALGRHEDAPVYVLGPESAISEKAFERIDEASAGAERVAGADPVENAIEFARFSSGGFGWNLNDPGHGFVVANADRPADAGAAAALSASGTWGPLLVTDDPEALPSALRGYLLDLKPGYQDDPTRAVYNHIWVIGDQGAISVAQQAQLDELAELVRVTSGSGGDVLGPPPGTPEPETPEGDQSGPGAPNDQAGGPDQGDTP